MIRFSIITRSVRTILHRSSWLILFAGVTVLLNSSTARATTIYVNAICGDDAKTGTSSNCADPNGPKLAIQNAITAAIDTDEIEVAPGTYNEAINFIGKAITLRSTDPSNPAVVAATIIDGSGVNSSVVKCVNREGSDTVLDGFTITGGTGTACRYSETCGGGMFNNYSSPTVTNCTFSENAAHYGAGMSNLYANPGVSNCAFSRNAASKVGGGMYNKSSPTVTDCTFTGNSAGGGGGMYNFDNSNPTVADCTFRANTATAGGGMYNDTRCKPAVTNCTFSKNTTATAGGMYNRDRSSPTVTNCTFSDNAADGSAGGMYNTGGSSPVVVNCTFRGNSAEFGGGIYNRDHSNPRVTNCILWGNSDVGGNGRKAQIFDSSDSLTAVTYSCVQDVIADDRNAVAGVGNIDTNPLFVDANGPDGVPGTGDENLGLSPRSPCIDSGNNAALPGDSHDFDGDSDTDEPIPVDLLGLERFFDDACMPDVGIPHPVYSDLGIVDMGALEYRGDMPGDLDGDGLVGCADNCPFHYNPDQADCDGYGLGDYCALELGVSRDCNGNEIPDDCDIGNGISTDVEGDGIPDECQRVFCVDDDAIPGQNGLTWETAVQHLQDALAIAQYGDEIRVAGGTYLPDQDERGNLTPGDRAATFQLRPGVAINGGYRGCPGGVCAGGDPGERNIKFYETILSGDLAGDDVVVASPDQLLEEPTRGENSYHVVTSISADETTVLNGVTIADGNANGGLQDNDGGGMYNPHGSSPTVKNCSFSRNSALSSGGGMCNIRSSSPTVSRCNFSGNESRGGGAMKNHYDSNPTVTNCTFSGNSSGRDGGAMSNYYSSRPTVRYCTFIRNAAHGYGGGMYNQDNCNPTVINCAFIGNVSGGGSNSGGAGMSNRVDSNPTVTNCTFSGNAATDNGGAIYNWKDSSPTISHCILWGNSPDEIYNYPYTGAENPIVSYCDVQGGLSAETIDGGGNIYVDPLFVRNPNDGGDGWGDDPDTPEIDEGANDDYGDLRLQSGSLCINAGDPDFIPDPGETDLDGHSRMLCGQVDMGAYEFGIGDFDCSDVVDLLDFAAWSSCMTGPDGDPYVAGCEAFDFDGDLDVDQQDYAAFATALSAP